MCQLMVEAIQSDRFNRIRNHHRMYAAYLVFHNSVKAAWWSLDVMLQRDLHLSDLTLETIQEETFRHINIQSSKSSRMRGREAIWLNL